MIVRLLYIFIDCGINKTVKMVGVFAFVLHDNSNNVTYAARDPIGVRSLCFGSSKSEYFLASEMKSLRGLCEDIKPFPLVLSEVLYDDIW